MTLTKQIAQIEQEIDDLREDLAAGLPTVPTFAQDVAADDIRIRIEWLEDELANLR